MLLWRPSLANACGGHGNILRLSRAGLRYEVWTSSLTPICVPYVPFPVIADQSLSLHPSKRSRNEFFGRICPIFAAGPRRWHDYRLQNRIYKISAAAHTSLDFREFVLPLSGATGMCGCNQVLTENGNRYQK